MSYNPLSKPGPTHPNALDIIIGLLVLMILCGGLYAVAYTATHFVG